MGKFDYLKGQLPQELLDILDRESATEDTNSLSIRRTRMDVWVDGTNGSDDNNGSTLALARKSLENLYRILPHRIEDCYLVIHVRGHVSSFETLTLPDLGPYSSILIDGGDEVTVIDDNSGSNFSVEAGTTASQLVTSGTPWSADEHTGYWIEILDSNGNPTGQIRLVFEGTTNTLIPGNNFDPVPSIGSDQFRIVRPTTQVHGGRIACQDDLTTYDGVVNSYLFVQRLYITNQWVFHGNVTRYLSAVVLNLSGGYPVVSFSETSQSSVNSSSEVYNPADFTALTAIKAGISGVGDEFIHILTSANVAFTNSILPRLGTEGGLLFIGSCRIRHGSFISNASDSTDYGYSNLIKYGDRDNIIDNPTGVGIKINGGQFSMSAVAVKGCNSHGIVNNGGVLRLAGTVSGSGNGGHGVKNESCGTLLVTNGSMPTVTGTGGDLLQGATTTTWAALDAAGQVIETTADLAVAKEV